MLLEKKSQRSVSHCRRVFNRMLQNGPNKFERYVTLDWKGLQVTNTLAYWPLIVNYKEFFVRTAHLHRLIFQVTYNFTR